MTLEASGARDAWRVAFEKAPIGITVTSAEPDTVGRFLEVNRAFCELTGYTPQELLSTGFMSITHPEDVARDVAQQARVSNGEISQFQIQKRYLRPDGGVVWVQLYSSLVHDVLGHARCMLNHVSDVTERKSMEAALILREQQLEEAQRLASLGSWEWNIAENVITWSDELYRIFGLKPGEFEASYEGFLDRVHPDDREAVDGAVHAAMAGSPSYEYDVRILRPDASVQITHARAKVIRDPHGSPLRMVGTAHDVTRARMADQALKERNKDLKLLGTIATAANGAASILDALETAVDEICAHTGWPVGHAYTVSRNPQPSLVSSGIWHIPQSEGFDAFRRRSEDVTLVPGFLPSQVLATGRAAWVDDAMAGPARPRSAEAAMAGLRSGFAFPVLVGDEVAAVLEFLCCSVMDAQGPLLRLMEQVGTLLGRVCERERARDALARARDLAIESSKLKSEFVATMSHEIRTPMNGVIGLTTLLSDTPLDATQRQLVEGMRASGERLLSIINDILDFSKIEAGKMEFEQVDFDPRVTVEDAGRLLADTARHKGLELVAYCQPDVPASVCGDAGRLTQILLNLVSNAVKFTEHGEVVLRASLVGGLDAEHIVLRFEVEDTGIGMSPADCKRLFEPFTQADASTTRRHGGTGLGLAISRSLAAGMGGTIAVRSELNRGSVFTLELPLRRPQGAGGPSAPQRHLLQGLRVLIVDENATNRRMLAAQLRAWDVNADEADDGSVGLGLLRGATMDHKPYSLAIVDLATPGAGLGFGRSIRADADLSTTRLLLLSSAAVDADTAASAGFVASMVKPVRLSGLFDVLGRVVSPSAVDAGPQPESPAPQRVLQRGRVLVVEDNRINQMVARGILNQLGFHCVVAEDGIEALEALSREHFDAVLMDAYMPRMDGLEATKQIRLREGTRHTPVIAMTAGASVLDRDLCLASGMDDFIAKPVRPADIDAALSRWVRDGPPPQLGASVATPVGTPRSGANEAAIDFDRIEALRAMDPAGGDGILSALVAQFLNDGPSGLSSVRQAIHEGDHDGLERSAHRLGGAAVSIGAVPVADLCRALESMARSPSLAPGEQLAQQLGHELDRAYAALADHITATP